LNRELVCAKFRLACALPLPKFHRTGACRFGFRTHFSTEWPFIFSAHSSRTSRSTPQHNLQSNGRVFATARNAGAGFPHFVVNRRQQTPGIRPTDNSPVRGGPVCVTPHSLD
jgi:hypothetical protein